MESYIEFDSLNCEIKLTRRVFQIKKSFKILVNRTKTFPQVFINE